MGTKSGCVAALFCTLLPLFAGEGKWTPAQMLQFDPAWLKQQGLQLPPSALWNPKTNSGLLSAAVNIGGCSAGFISRDGLIATNHHCLFGIVQQHSSKDRDLIANGFLAHNRAEELPGKGVRVTVPRRFTDVTASVLAAVPAGADDSARYHAIEARQKQLVAECEKQPGTRCSIAVMDGGVSYILAEAMELSDIRLVYSPPRWVGEYGGEVDNWMWPRHAGDFAMARAYVGRDGKPAEYSEQNVPYQPAAYFPVSRAGVAPGDFVMVLGYPGLTYRSLTAEEMSERRDLFFPARVDLLGEYIGILESVGKRDRASAIRVAATLKSLSNVYKNAEGQLAGFRRGNILEKQRQADQEVLRWVASHPDHAAAATAYTGLEKLTNEKRATWQRDFLLSSFRYGARSLDWAVELVRLSRQRAKTDAERRPEYMERNWVRIRQGLDRSQSSFDATADSELLAAFAQRCRKLPGDQKIAAIDSAFSGCADNGCFLERATRLLSRTRVSDRDERLRMFDESGAQLAARHDPLLDIAGELATQVEGLEARQDAWLGAVSRLRPEWRHAVIAQAGKPVAPDANGSLRLSFAHVAGYSPRDAVLYEPQTTLRGMLEKATGEEPFLVPEKVRAAVERGDLSPWTDSRLKDLPVDFLADADTTGGNSGSPVVNGKGELVGLNFDRVWENVANDFGYNPDVARNVNVDVRYLLWMLDRVEGAVDLVKEMTGR